MLSRTLLRRLPVQATASVATRFAALSATRSAPLAESDTRTTQRSLFRRMLQAVGVAAVPATTALAETSGAGAASSVAVSPFLAKFLAVSPPACFIFLQASGMKTVREIQQEKSVGDRSVLPFLSLMVNCMTWSVYGAMVQDMTVLLPNLSGVCFGAYQTYVYAQHNKASLATYYATAGAILASVGVMATTLPLEVASHSIGLTGCALAVFMMSSPLAVIRTVIKDKSTAALPFITSAAVFFNSSTWFGYGYLVADNPLIYVPNGLGWISAVVQLSLFAVYPRK